MQLPKVTLGTGVSGVLPPVASVQTAPEIAGVSPEQGADAFVDASETVYARFAELSAGAELPRQMYNGTHPLTGRRFILEGYNKAFMLKLYQDLAKYFMQKMVEARRGYNELLSAPQDERKNYVQGLIDDLNDLEKGEAGQVLQNVRRIQGGASYLSPDYDRNFDAAARHQFSNLMGDYELLLSRMKNQVLIDVRDPYPVPTGSLDSGSIEDIVTLHSERAKQYLLRMELYLKGVPERFGVSDKPAFVETVYELILNAIKNARYFVRIAWDPSTNSIVITNDGHIISGFDPFEAGTHGGLPIQGGGFGLYQAKLVAEKNGQILTYESIGEESILTLRENRTIFRLQLGVAVDPIDQRFISERDFNGEYVASLGRRAFHHVLGQTMLGREKRDAYGEEQSMLGANLVRSLARGGSIRETIDRTRKVVVAYEERTGLLISDAIINRLTILFGLIERKSIDLTWEDLALRGKMTIAHSLDCARQLASAVAKDRGVSVEKFKDKETPLDMHPEIAFLPLSFLAEDILIAAVKASNATAAIRWDDDASSIAIEYSGTTPIEEPQLEQFVKRAAEDKWELKHEPTEEGYKLSMILNAPHYIAK